jgi:hypothetical protein
MSLSGPGDAGGAAVAQPGGVFRRLDAACLVVFAAATLGLAIWAGSAVWAACDGRLGAPLDDSYIHFQFARSFARFHPFEYAAGLPRVPGATSLLWPALLTPAIWLGAGPGALLALTWVLGFVALFGQASEVYLSSRRFLSQPLAFAAGLLVLSFSANTWFAGSAMEVVPLGFVLLRCARLSAEFWEGERSDARQRELLLLAFAAALLRPEGLLGALCVAGAFARGGKATRIPALLALAAPLCAPLINFIFTGTPTQTTTLAKWLPTNPYYRGHLLEAVWYNVQLFYGTLLNGEKWSWTFIPEGYRLVGLASLPALWLAAERRGARVHAACLCLVGLGMLIPTTYETFLVNRLRYLWPFSGPWLLGLAALGELLALPLARSRPRLAWLGLGAPALAGWGFWQLAPISVADLAQSAAAITNQQVSLGQWAAEQLPPDARLGVNDAGAIPFFSGRRSFDIVGLTTQGEARYWIAGAGSRFEHYERMPRDQLPTHFFVYPEWFGIPNLLGDCLTERRVDGATILGGPVMVACRADYSSFGSGAKSVTFPAANLIDELDVADLESETSHGYVLGPASSQDNVVEVQGLPGNAGPRLVDGGRRQRRVEGFRMKLTPGGSLVMRLSVAERAEGRVSVGGKLAQNVLLEAGDFQEIVVGVGQLSGQQDVLVQWTQPVTVLHYWSFGRVL